MNKAIDFAVRNSAGGRAHGSFAGPGQNNFIQVAAGDSISLNITASSVVAYEQHGRDLVIKLADGRTVVLANYFDGTPHQLYLSTNDAITEVVLTNDGSGVLAAHYGPVQNFGKWSPLDELRFAGGDSAVGVADVNDEPAGMGLFAPALFAGGAGLGTAGLVGAGLIGAAAIGGGGGDASGGGNGTGGGTHNRLAPSVDNPDASNTFTTNTQTPKAVVTGTGEPGDAVTVTLGDKTQTTTIRQDGTWGVEFDGANLPGDGSYSTEVTVTEPGGKVHVLDGPDYIIDMTPPLASFTSGTQSVGDLENLADFADGITIGGTGEVGATLTLELESITRTTTIDSSGSWSFTFSQSEIAGGERTVDVTLTATDRLGNRTVVTDRLEIDTVPHPLGIYPVTANNLVNEAEQAAGFDLTGTTTANTNLTLTVEANGTTVTQQVTSDANGRWSATLPAGSLPVGSYDATATLTAVDAAGNPSHYSHSFRVDTEIDLAIDATQAVDNKVSGDEQAAGFKLTGTGEPGATITVVTTTPTGDLTHGPVTVGSDGSWSITYGPGQLPGGVYDATMKVTAVDAAENTTTESHVLSVDTEARVAIDAVQMADNVINAAEAGADITLTGTAEPLAKLTVSFNGHSYSNITSDAAGNWSVNVPQANVPTGTSTAVVSVVAVDALGNSATANHTVIIDTEVVPFTLSSSSAGSDGVINAAEAARGLTVTGTVEAGSSVQVSFAGHAAITAQVSGGVWSVAIPAAQIPAGTTTADMVITATDRYGNSAELKETVPIDREVVPMRPQDAQLAGDGYLNAAEAEKGLVVAGETEPYSTLVVRIMDGNTQLSQSTTVQVGADGKWSYTFQGAALPRGEINAEVVVTVTDRAQNTDEYSQSVVIDTSAPGAPDVIGFQRNAAGLTRIVTSDANESYEFTRINADGTVSDIAAVRSIDGITGEQNVTFGAFNGNSFVQAPVPDGSYLVVDSTDLSGNQSSTLMIVNNTNAPQVDLARPGLGQFDVSAIDLTFAPDAELTITEAQILNLTGADKTLVVKGGVDDRVEIIGGQDTGKQTVIDGESYNIFTVGTSGATIYLDDDIQPL